jgi:hypothetical protein
MLTAEQAKDLRDQAHGFANKFAIAYSFDGKTYDKEFYAYSPQDYIAGYDRFDTFGGRGFSTLSGPSTLFGLPIGSTKTAHLELTEYYVRVTGNEKQLNKQFGAVADAFNTVFPALKTRVSFDPHNLDRDANPNASPGPLPTSGFTIVPVPSPSAPPASPPCP